MYFPGYHKNYGPEIDAYGNVRCWSSSRAAFVGAHELSRGVGALDVRTVQTISSTPGTPGTGPAVATPGSRILQFRDLKTDPSTPAETPASSSTGLIVFGVLGAAALALLIFTVKR